MVRSGVRQIWFAAALSSVAACRAGNLQGGASGGRGGGSISVTGSAGITGMNCASIQQPVVASGLDVLILLDSSQSMNNATGGGSCDGGCGAVSKWALATAAINTVVAETDQSVTWGLAFFGDVRDGGCTISSRPAAPLISGAGPRIAVAITARTSANGDLALGGPRPTRPAVNAAAAYLAAAPDDNRKLIVLVTDGVPNCIPGNADPSADDAAGTSEAIVSAATQGLPTFVVGIATFAGPADAALNQMAIAGGVPRAGSPAYYPAASTPDLVAALNSIVAGASSCVFPIPPPSNSDTDRMHIGVSVDGMELPQDTTHSNGWDFADAGYNYFQIYGPPCDAVTNQPAGHSVQVVFKCLLL